MNIIIIITYLLIVVSVHNYKIDKVYESRKAQNNISLYITAACEWRLGKKLKS